MRGLTVVAYHRGPMTESTPPHPVLEKYYSTAADRESFVGGLFDPGN